MAKKISGVTVKGSPKAANNKDFDIDHANLEQCRKKLVEQKKLISRQKTEIEKLKKLLAAENEIIGQQNNEIEFLENKLVEKVLIMNGEKW